MEINTNNERATLSQKMAVEMLLADVPETGHKWVSDDKNHPHGELSLWAKKLGVEPRSSLKELRRDVVEQDTSHPAMFVICPHVFNATDVLERVAKSRLMM